MRLIASLLLLCVVAAAAPVMGESAGANTLTIQFAATEVVIRGLTPNASVVVLMIAREPQRYASRTLESTEVLATDAEGVARLLLKRPLVPRTIVAAVDFETGRYAIGTPPGMPLHFAELPRQLLKKQNADEFEQVAVGMGWLEALCVRPRKGAWRLYLVDGAPADRDGAPDGGVLIDATQMRRVHGPDETPSRFRPHDVLIVIHPRRLEVMATEVRK